MALLSAYCVQKEEGESLEDFLDKKVFADAKKETICADKEDMEGFDRFLDDYKKALAVERAAVENVG